MTHRRHAFRLFVLLAATVPPPTPSWAVAPVTLHGGRGEDLWLPAGARLRGRLQASRATVVLRTDEGTRSLPIPHGAFDVALGQERDGWARVGLRAAASARLDAQVILRRMPAPPFEEPVRGMIVYLVDTLRADRLGAYGGTLATPSFDAFARAATVFEARAVASWTKPSVASALTGRFPWEHGADRHGAALHPDVPLVTERLQARGVRTAAFVGNGYIAARHGFARGWDAFEHLPRDARAIHGRLLAWLDTLPPAAPFFAYVHVTEPHAPYTPPAHLLARRDPAPYAGPIDFERHPRLLRGLDVTSLDARDRARLVALYDAEVEGLDQAFGELQRALRDRGFDADTALLVLSDHGEELFDHGAIGHGGKRLEDAVLRVPMMLRWPGRPGGRAARLASSIDVAPTLLHALAPGEALDAPYARSLLDLALAPPGPRVVFAGRSDGARLADDGRHALRQADGRRALLDRAKAGPAPRARRQLYHALRRLPAARERTPLRPFDPELLVQLRRLGYVD